MGGAGPQAELNQRASRASMSRSAFRWLVFKVDIVKLLTVVIAHDKASVVKFFDGPGRREAAGCRGIGSPLNLA